MTIVVIGWLGLAAWRSMLRRPTGRLSSLREARADRTRPSSARRRAIAAVSQRIGTDLSGLRLSVWVGAFSVVALVWVAAPPAGVLVAVAMAISFPVRARSERRRRVEQIGQALPDTLEVMGLAIRAGLVPAEALAIAAAVAVPPIDNLLGGAIGRLGRGGAWSDTVSRLATELGPCGLGLALLLDGDGGAPLADGLARLAAEMRDRRRREIQRRAQRLPVAVLTPLITCILPAFLLTTILPIVSVLGRDVATQLPLGDAP